MVETKKRGRTKFAKPDEKVEHPLTLEGMWVGTVTSEHSLAIFANHKYTWRKLTNILITVSEKPSQDEREPTIVLSHMKFKAGKN